MSAIKRPTVQRHIPPQQIERLDQILQGETQDISTVQEVMQGFWKTYGSLSAGTRLFALKLIYAVLLRMNKDFKTTWIPLSLENIRAGDKLREGAFTTTYRGHYHGEEVVYKVLPNILRLLEGYNQAGDAIKDFGRAMQQWQTYSRPGDSSGGELTSPPALPLLGCSLIVEQSEQTVYLVICSSFAKTSDNGQLLASDKTINIHDSMSKVADVMAYLHSKNVVHGSIHAGNVVWYKDYLCFTDFGHSKFHGPVIAVSIKPKQTPIRGSHSPESVLEPHPACTKEEDVFAFGCLVYQWFQNDLPTFHLYVDRIDLPSRPSVMADVLWHIITSCWEFKSADRPSADSLARLIKNLKPDEIYYAADADQLFGYSE